MHYAICKGQSTKVIIHVAISSDYNSLVFVEQKQSRTIVRFWFSRPSQYFRSIRVLLYSLSSTQCPSKLYRMPSSINVAISTTDRVIVVLTFNVNSLSLNSCFWRFNSFTITLARSIVAPSTTDVSTVSRCP
jgi:hypothetical protein